jgi:hypothetical protein
MTTQTALSEVQTAIYQKLTGGATLMALVTGVFDFGAVPDDQAYPFISIGDTTEGPDNTFETRGYEDTVTLHIWDNAKGFKRCQTILAEMNRLLDQQSLALSTHHHVGTQYEFSESLNDSGTDDLRHMPVRYRVQTQEQ